MVCSFRGAAHRFCFLEEVLVACTALLIYLEKNLCDQPVRPLFYNLENMENHRKVKTREQKCARLFPPARVRQFPFHTKTERRS